MLVKAIQTGHYGHLRRKPGSIFELKPVKGKDVTLSPQDQFSKKWMRKLNEKEIAQYNAQQAAANDVGEDDIDESEMANAEAENMALAAHASSHPNKPVTAQLTKAQKAAATKAANKAKAAQKEEQMTDSADA